MTERWRLITLFDGRQCLVDEVDWYGWIHQHRWNTIYKQWYNEESRYVRRAVGPSRSTLYLHREVMMRADPREPEFMAEHLVDHVNRQKLDCRRCNLRWATRKENNQNRGLWPSLEEIMAANPNPVEHDIPF